MAIESAQQIEQASPEAVTRWKFTVDDYYRMGELGMFPHGVRVQLVDGEVYRMPPIGPEHAGSVEKLGDRLRRLIGDTVMVRTQNPVRLATRSEPEPDVAVVLARDDYYTSRHPAPGDVVLIVEVSSSTFSFDRNEKSAAYAQAGLADYWIVDLVHRHLLVLRDPCEGVYHDVRTLTREDTVRPLSFPEIEIAVADILG